MDKLREKIAEIFCERVCGIGGVCGYTSDKCPKSIDFPIDLILSLLRQYLEEKMPKSDRPYLEYIDICDRELRGVEAYVKEGNFNKIMQIIRSTEKAGIQLGKHQSLAEIRTIIQGIK